METTSFISDFMREIVNNPGFLFRLALAIGGLFWLIRTVRKWRARRAASKERLLFDRCEEMSQEDIDAMMGKKPEDDGKYVLKNQLHRKDDTNV
jgi:hypothetical protein